MVGYSSLFASGLGLATKNIEQLCEEHNCSSRFPPFFRDQNRKLQYQRKENNERFLESGYGAGDYSRRPIINIDSSRGGVAEPDDPIRIQSDVPQSSHSVSDRSKGRGEK